MADDDDRVVYESSQHDSWTTHIYPHSHHGTPAQEFGGFHFGSQSPPMDSGPFVNSGGGIHQRPVHAQLQPLIMPQWPSMLSSQFHSTYQQAYPPPVQTMQPMAVNPYQTPVSATSNRSASTPRKTLTDNDRKRMCQYAEEHPTSKQTEIGAIFGVERSTVSKVLRQKDKYLLQDDGSRSPIKRAKGRSPDIERALAVWAKNHEKKGMPLTDDIIRDKARKFSATTKSRPEDHATISATWIEKFKLKNNLMGARSRKGSLANDSEPESAVASSAHTPGDTSPISPDELRSPSPIDLRSAQSQDSLKTNSPDGFVEFSNRHAPFHSQSTNSLNSAFADTAPSPFSPGPLSPTSPFFTPDSGTAPSPFIPNPPQTARPTLPATPGSNNQRPRSQTFPLHNEYMNTDLPTPKFQNMAVLDSPMEEAPDALASIDDHIREQSATDNRPNTVTPLETMRPPPIPIRHAKHESQTANAAGQGTQTFTSPEEARRAMEVVLSFFQQQPNGFLDLEESVTIGKLMEKLKLQTR